MDELDALVRLPSSFGEPYFYEDRISVNGIRRRRLMVGCPIDPNHSRAYTGRIEDIESAPIPKCRKCKKTPEQKRQMRVDRYRKDPRKTLISNGRHRAKKLGREFDIEFTDITIPSFCPVLGIPIIIAEGLKTDNSPSIDRIDQSKGYVRGNVEVISYRANRLKSDASLKEVEKIYNWMQTMLQ